MYSYRLLVFLYGISKFLINMYKGLKWHWKGFRHMFRRSKTNEHKCINEHK